MVGWVAGIVSLIWLEVAHGTGYLARLFGDRSREFDPQHRRDGSGLVVLLAAIVFAAGAWWRLGSPAGRALTASVRDPFGAGASIIPFLLALLAWRILRHPDKNAHSGRMAIGWTALMGGALGIVNIALGSLIRVPDVLDKLSKSNTCSSE